MAKLDNKVAVVTGGSSGIGRATAIALAAEGAAVAIGGRKADALEEVAGVITAQGGRVLTQTMDVRDEKQVAALLGAAPRANQSGKRDKRRRTKGGRRRLRAALHMPAIVASNANPDLKAFKQRLKAEGKNNAVILTAVMRKLIILANALIRDRRKWSPDAP